ncbi:MATE family efflux transporter [Haloplasma contractile]|uniref:Probable multidrug resistance protein NorM n=1 Tax=Haloplasma contractile SSD-17B TaxID=1033810 RepID=U2FKX5_9MOLU|nr:MATE family efflux transporter [Haloplasma contractile]ERJ11864.1 tryptophanyl-tRNA synthetase protein [Haloplasma contractile SSD-17B]
MNVISDDPRPRQMRRNILILAWPAILRLFLQSLVGTVDLAMVGNLGKSAIGAVGVSNRIVFIILGAFTALSIGSTALVAHYIGAGKKEKGNEILWQSLMMAVLMAGVFALIGLFFARNLLELMLSRMSQPDVAILRDGSIYIKIVLASMIFGFPLMIINAVFQGVGDMKTPMVLMIITNLTNVTFNFLFINGIWFFPEMGAVGVGIGTAIGRTTGCLVGIAILIKGKSHLKLAFKYLKFKFDTVILKSIFKIGLPSSFEQFARQSSTLLFTALIAGIGITQAQESANIAANEIVMRVNMLLIMPGFGFSVAATTLVGQSLGAGKEELAERYGKQASLLVMILMVPFSIVLFIFAEPIARIFIGDDLAVGYAVTSIRIILVVQPLLALVLAFSGGLRGAGDTTWVMIITVIGNWGFRVLLAYILGYHFGLGLAGFWLGMAFDVAVRALLMTLRFMSGKWKDIEVISKKEKLEAVAEV